MLKTLKKFNYCTKKIKGCTTQVQPFTFSYLLLYKDYLDYTFNQ